LIQGVAMAAFFVPLMTLIFSGITPDKIPAASGLSNFVRILAGSFGASIFTSAWENGSSVHHSVLVENINYANPVSQSVITMLTDGGMSQQQALAFINNLINKQSATLAANDLTWLSALLFIALIAFIWLIRPKKTSTASNSADTSGAH